MNSNRATLVCVLVAIVAACIYEAKRSREIGASLAALTRDRDTLSRQVKLLTQTVADLNELQKTAHLPATTAESGPTATGASAPGASQSAVPGRIVPVATPTVSITAPKGWWKNGSKNDSYVVGVDRDNAFNGLPSAYVKSLDPKVDGFGGMMQSSSAEEFRGKRVRLSGWMKTQDANDGGGHLWLRVDGSQQGQTLQFDNMNGRAPKGTTDWQQYSVVLDVPPEAGSLNYGFFVEGTGQVWVNGTTIEEVGPDVPSTNLNRQRQLPKTPRNINFTEGG